MGRAVCRWYAQVAPRLPAAVSRPPGRSPRLDRTAVVDVGFDSRVQLNRDRRGSGVAVPRDPVRRPEDRGVEIFADGQRPLTAYMCTASAPDPVEAPGQPAIALTVAVENGQYRIPGGERLWNPPQLRVFSPFAHREELKRHRLAQGVMRVRKDRVLTGARAMKQPVVMDRGRPLRHEGAALFLTPPAPPASRGRHLAQTQCRRFRLGGGSRLASATAPGARCDGEGTAPRRGDPVDGASPSRNPGRKPASLQGAAGARPTGCTNAGAPRHPMRTIRGGRSPNFRETTCTRLRSVIETTRSSNQSATRGRALGGRSANSSREVRPSRW